MVKISSTYVGVASGVLGSGVYYTRKGKTCCRQYVPHINDANSEEQQKERGEFTTSQGICGLLKDAIKIFWTTETPKQTKINSLMSYTKQNAAHKLGDEWLPDWKKVKFASGSLVGMKNTGITNPNGTDYRA